MVSRTPFRQPGVGQVADASRSADPDSSEGTRSGLSSQVMKRPEPGRMCSIRSTSAGMPIRRPGTLG